MIYFCSQKNRRALVLQSAALNGIDYLEVIGNAGCGKQLAVTLLKDARALTLTQANVSISGGAPVQAVSVSPATAADPFVLTVNLNQSGDFSTYTLALVTGAGITDPPVGFDPQLSSISFSFKAGCPTPADCIPDNCCPPPAQLRPGINYLAKDYEAFRQVIFDRLAVTTPAWAERHAADLGVAMVETLAYAADHLSYQQDAVSTEAYIGTARSRISLRRHARLVDYKIGEGCNARTWVALTTAADNLQIPAGTLFYVRVPGLPPVAKAGDPVAQQLARNAQPVFAAIEPATLFTEQNKMDFYTWSDTQCCLAPGATQATLLGHLSTLQPGQVLIFEEVVGPHTGDGGDANPANRCAVMLTSVVHTDSQQKPLSDPLNGRQITQIAWSEDDALLFPLCLSALTDAAHGSLPVVNVSVARGNILPADHGVWIDSEALGPVPEAPPAPASSGSCTCGSQALPPAPVPRYYPQLANSPLTFSPPFSGISSAASFLSPDIASALPQIAVKSDDGFSWSPQPDLLSSNDTDHAFVPEIERDQSIFLRFGDRQYGAAPDTGVSFYATYRVGNGSIGNIGRDSLAHAVLPHNFLPPLSSLSAVRNPLAAAGGIDPEDMQHIVQYAPFSYESQLRCVTETDYGQMAAQSSAIREARGTLRWTGSWYTAFVSIDPATALTPQLVCDTTSRLNLLRMMGVDLAVEGAVIVGLQITMEICVDPEHFQGDVYEALIKVFITGNQCNGQAGLLNAANFTFGETVYASPLIAAAQSVEGVLSATLTVFARMDDPSADGVAQGYLTMGRLEIPRCDNDPNRLDHGVFALQMDGGK
ncbi:MAG TPA: hypothetical protein VGR96_04880 [Acidobacteriaceae bacterium]|nr:hypothetical protein [Acidobacteriaceae bacterium]